MTVHESGFKWCPSIRVEKFGPEHVAAVARQHRIAPEQVTRDLLGEPDDVVVDEGNLVTTAGLERIVRNLTGQTPGSVFDSDKGLLGVGDSSTAEAKSQTGMVAATNKYYKKITANPSVSSQDAGVNWQFSASATFGTSEANFAWNEWGCAISNATATDGTTFTGILLNRKVASLGTKASGASWTLTVAVKLT